MDKKGFILLSALLISITTVTAQSGLNLYNSNINLQDNNITNPNEIKNFFDSACGQDSAVAQVYSNGSYSCVDIPDLEKQNLSEVLAEGNVANQSIDMSENNITNIGSSGTSFDNYGGFDVNPEGGSLDQAVDVHGDIALNGNDRAISIGGAAGSYDLILEGQDSGVVAKGGNILVDGGSDANGGGKGSVYIGSQHTSRIGLGTSSPDTFVDIEGGKLDLSSNNITGVSNLEGFFDQDRCGSDEAVKTVYPNGSYACNSISTDQTVENLSETLAAGNVANQTIEFSTPIAIGDSDTSSTGAFGDSVAVGKGAESTGSAAVALGGASNAEGADSLAFGYSSDAFDSGSISAGDSSVARGTGSIAFGKFTDTGSLSSGAIALGIRAQAPDKESIAIGDSAETSADGAIAIGNNSRAPNSNEATFGNLQGQELDVNVTGNATIHGEDLDLKDGDIENFFDQDKCGDSEAVKTVYPNGSYACNSISSDQTVENLSETLAAGNVANQTIEFGDSAGLSMGGASTSTNLATDIAIGKGSSASGSAYAVSGTNSRALAIGDQASAGTSIYGEWGTLALGYKSSATDVDRSIAIGSESLVTGNNAVALGSLSHASTLGAVAIGDRANAPNEYEATFGNLGDERLDVNVTGNLTVHEGVEMPNGIAIGDGDTSADNEYSVAIGSNSSTAGSSFYPSVAIGRDVDASGASSVAIGSQARTVLNDGVAIGNLAETTESESIALGYGTEADGSLSVALGSFSRATGTGAMALGNNAESSQDYTARFGSDSQ
ncbi:MAG: hypothetical protein ACI8Z7_000314, partial [Candidatus Nanohaloarchaea archaeon]